MVHLPHLITDLALLLAVAGVTTLFFRRITQPVVLGYIIAGFLVGPHVLLIPTVVDSEGIKIWSEIGVIFLLFSLGLKFSFRKLFNVGGASFVTALVGITCMNGIGFLTGHLLGGLSWIVYFLVPYFPFLRLRLSCGHLMNSGCGPKNSQLLLSVS